MIVRVTLLGHLVGGVEIVALGFEPARFLEEEVKVKFVRVSDCH